MHIVAGECFNASKYTLNHYISVLIEVAATFPELVVDSDPQREGGQHLAFASPGMGSSNHRWNTSSISLVVRLHLPVILLSIR